MDDSDRGHSDEENEVRQTPFMGPGTVCACVTNNRLCVQDVARLVAMLKRLQTDNVELRRNFESVSCAAWACSAACNPALAWSNLHALLACDV